MQNPKDYLQQKIGPCVQHLFENYLPEEDFKSVHDLFNVQKFHKLLMCILSEQVKQKIIDVKLIDDSDNLTYNEMRKRNFRKIYEIIQQTYEFLGLGLAKRLCEKDIGRMIDSADMKVMTLFMEYVFELLKHNKNVLEFITTLDESIQSSIMQVMENSQLTQQEFHMNSEHSVGSLKMLSKISPNNDQPHSMSQLEEMQTHLQRMESHIQIKDDEIKDLKFVKQQLEEEIQQCKKQLHIKHEEIEMFKKRMLSYEEIDQLMIQKDQQILKLTKKLADQQLKSRLKQSELINENKSLHEKINQFESKDNELLIKFDKQKSIIESLNKQKEQAEISMKKVINNLKQKNKSLMDKINDLQTQLTEVKFQKEMKEKQLNQIKMTNPNQKKPVSINFDDINSPRTPRKEELSQGLFDSLTGNYSRLGEQLSIQLDRADLQDEFGLNQRSVGNKRFNQLLQENYSLKQQLQKIQSCGFADSKQSRQLQDEVQKMKKKINILKRRNDEIENQRKEEIDIMVGIIDHCYQQSLNKAK